MLTIENVTKRFGEIVALDRVSLSLARGEFFGLLGPNGAGKTTLMSLVAGLRAPDSGSISINGQRVGPNAMAPRHELGFVPQAIALYEELSAEENLRLFGKLYGLAGQELRARVDHGLHAAQLFERRRRSAIAKRHLRVPPATECRRDDDRLFDALHGGSDPALLTHCHHRSRPHARIGNAR